MIDRLATPPPLPDRLVVLLDGYRRIAPFDFAESDYRWIGLLWLQTAMTFAESVPQSDRGNEQMDVLVSGITDILARLEPYRQSMIDEASDAGY